MHWRFLEGFNKTKGDGMSTDQEYWDACLIKTWRNDGKLVDAFSMFKSVTGRLVFDREEPLLRTPALGVPLRLRVRPYVAQHLEKISRRLWDYSPEHDVALLKKLQTSKYTTSTTKTNPDKEMTNARNLHKNDKKRLAMFSLQNSVRNQATNWGVTKGTGRSARVGRA
jgi:hypothetical protein